HARNFGPWVSSRKTLRTSGEDIGFAVQRGNQPIDTFAFEDGPEFRATGRHLADRAVKVDVGDQPCIAIASHHIINIDWLTVRFDDLALHHETSSSWLFSGDLQFLPGVAVETIGIDCRDVTPEAFDDLLPLRLGQRDPGRAHRQAGHCRDIEAPTYNPNFGSCLQARRQFACRFATIAGGVNLAGGVLAGLVAGRADIFAAPRWGCDTSAALHPTAPLFRASWQKTRRCADPRWEVGRTLVPNGWLPGSA